MYLYLYDPALTSLCMMAFWVGADPSCPDTLSTDVFRVSAQDHPPTQVGVGGLNLYLDDLFLGGRGKWWWQQLDYGNVQSVLLPSFKAHCDMFIPEMSLMQGRT